MKACNKFEELFILDDEKQLLEHIMSCEDCRKEYEEMKAVTSLIQESSSEGNSEYRKPLRGSCCQAE